MSWYQSRYRVESTRKRGHDYSSPGTYFVTICTKNMRCSLGTVKAQRTILSEVRTIVERCWLEIPSHYKGIEVGEFVIMPNHIHGLIRIAGQHRYTPDALIVGPTGGPTLGTIVGGFKAGVSRWCRENAIFDFAWQERFYDEIVRGDAALAAIREYIRANPENWWTDELYRESRQETGQAPSLR